MASLIVRKLDANPVVLDDIGLTITGPLGTTFDLITEEAQDISMSADLVAAIGVTLEVLDPRDGATLLSTADGILAIQNHNLPHFGIEGGRFNDLDAPGASLTDKFIVEYDSASDKFQQVDSSSVIYNNQDTVANIAANALEDGSDTNVTYNPTVTPLLEGQDETNYDGTAPNGTFDGGSSGPGANYIVGEEITLSDGSVITVDAVDGDNDVTDFTVTTNGGNVTAGVTLTQTSSDGSGSGFTLTPENPNIQPGSIQVNVDDSFLRNDGDTLDSGTLNIASGANLTIQDAPVNPKDAVNKEYVDAAAAGLDPKESVRYATTGDPGGTFNSSGGTGGTGEFTAIDLTSSANFDGLSGGAIQVGDRILIKDRAGANAPQNGIYVVTTAGAAGVIERAPDQDGSPAAEVSGGNFTFVEEGTALAGTGWVVVADGIINLNVDDIVWTQFSESTSLNAGLGLSQGGSDFDVDINDLPSGAAAIDGANDLIAFHDANGAAAGSGSGAQTYQRTFDQMMADLDIVNGVTTNGIIVRTGAGTYSNAVVAAAGAGALDGLDVQNGDGTTGTITVGLDIANLPARPAIDGADLVAVYDQAGNNVSYTVSDIAGALASVNSFETWAGAGNTTGDGSIVADSATDTATLSGGDGINIDVTAATDTLVFSLTRAGLADTAVEGADTVPFFDDSNSNAPEYRSWTNIISDLNILTTGNLDSWGTITLSGNTDGTGDTSIVPVGTEDGLGLVGGTGIELDGDNTGKSVEARFARVGMADTAVEGTDTIPFFDGSNANEPEFRSINDLLDDLNLPSVTTINGQPIMTYTDTTRGDKTLSVESHPYTFGENSLVHLDWIRPVGNATDADSGYIMPLDGTVVFATAHCENTSGADTKDIHLFINGTDQGSLGTLAGGANVTFNNNTVNLDFNAGDRIRLQAQGAATGNIEDTVASVTVRWRG